MGSEDLIIKYLNGQVEDTALSPQDLLHAPNVIGRLEGITAAQYCRLLSLPYGVDPIDRAIVEAIEKISVCPDDKITRSIVIRLQEWIRGRPLCAYEIAGKIAAVLERRNWGGLRILGELIISNPDRFLGPAEYILRATARNFDLSDGNDDQWNYALKVAYYAALVLRKEGIWRISIGIGSFLRHAPAVFELGWFIEICKLLGDTDILELIRWYTLNPSIRRQYLAQWKSIVQAAIISLAVRPRGLTDPHSSPVLDFLLQQKSVVWGDADFRLNYAKAVQLLIPTQKDFETLITKLINQGSQTHFYEIADVAELFYYLYGDAAVGELDRILPEEIQEAVYGQFEC